METQTAGLTGVALNWAVAKCDGVEKIYYFNYSTDWVQGGWIIEREGMGVWMYQWNEDGEPEAGWYAEDKDGNHVQKGPTPLIAAMRCYVASKLGDEVDIPQGFL
jgi:hypothetical protein